MAGHSTDLVSHEAGEAAVVVVEHVGCYLNRVTILVVTFFTGTFSKSKYKK